MSGSKSPFPPDKTEAERRKNLTPRDVKDLELAGGVEGGMQAGSAGGPGERKAAAAEDSTGKTPRRR